MTMIRQLCTKLVEEDKDSMGIQKWTLALCPRVDECGCTIRGQWLKERKLQGHTFHAQDSIPARCDWRCQVNNRKLNKKI